MSKSTEHYWGVLDRDGVRACIRNGCTVRIARDGAVWQRKKGAHWREVKSRFGVPEPIPNCRGEVLP